MSRDLELRDVNPIGEKIWLVGQGARSPRYPSKLVSFRATAYFGASKATIFSKRGLPRSGPQLDEVVAA